ncbi:MAG: reverse transcriptase family protein [Pseudomonadota bacterium]|nr:reverse transcriptase family protein [Pseudomonadota bacterium]
MAERSQAARIQKSTEYPILRRQVTTAIRRDRNLYWQTIADEAERAAACGDIRKLYQLINKTRKPKHQVSETLLDNTGAVITDMSERVQRWEEYFTTLLNHPLHRTDDPVDDTQNVTLYQSNSDAPTIQEIIHVIGMLKNGKAAGEDRIPAEFFKCCPSTMATWLHRIITQIWTSERVPEDWSDSLLLPTFKKGDKKMCSNYRGISLIDVAAKIFATILLRRFQKERDTRTRPNQSGFRPGRGCTDQIFTLRRVLEHRWSYQQPTVACFVDFKAAFDSVDRGALWKIMQKDGLPPKLLRLIKAYYSSTRTKVRVYGQESRPFRIVTGVRQGCALSPTLFNYVVDWVLSHALESHPGVHLGPNFNLTDLAYADDVVILGPTFSEVQQAINDVNRFSQGVGLRINIAKTKVLTALVPDDQHTAITIDGEPLEEVDSFIYLGSKCIPTGQGFADIDRRISLARSTFACLQKGLWSRREISTRTKSRIYQAVVRTTLLYGSETWPLRVADRNKIEVFDNDCLRRILHVRRIEHIPVSTLQRKCHLLSMPSLMLQRRLRWFGHVARRSPGELLHEAVHLTPRETWRKRLGGQLKTWTTTIKQDLALITGPQVHGLRPWNRNWLQLSVDFAQNRSAWAAAVRDVVNGREEASSIRPG